MSPPGTKKDALRDESSGVHENTRVKTTAAADASPRHSSKTLQSSNANYLAAIEAGEEKIENHLEVFSTRLHEAIRPRMPSETRLAHSDWIDLYQRNQHPHGRHFVIHQHDHPVSGPHYDLRLQFSESSSLSFALMYGLPGNPNSRKLNRNATETRVHNLWVWSVLANLHPHKSVYEIPS